LKRNKGLKSSLLVYGMFGNFFLYQAVMTGIYNYRIRELLNMKKVPLLVKFGISSAITGSMCYALYNDRLYDEEHYRIALKYRHEYDEKYKEHLQNQKIGNFKPSTLTQ
jgi:cephalosporin-C deacetylase-like acetyl esterase